MSASKLLESTKRARAAINESAAATAELTRQMKPETVFLVPTTDGINKGQLVYELRAKSAPITSFEEVDGKFIIATRNPRNVANALRLLGLKATIQGDVVDLLADSLADNQNNQSPLGNDASAKPVGESLITKLAKKFFRG